jgi:hypothetical protein
VISLTVSTGGYTEINSGSPPFKHEVPKVPDMAIKRFGLFVGILVVDLGLSDEQIGYGLLVR